MRLILRFLPKTLEGCVRLAAAFVFVGILTAIPTLFWTHALSFMSFAIISGSLIGLGILIYLVALVHFLRHPHHDT